MRGFRGSRAAQSFNSSSERHYQRKTERESFLRMAEQRPQPKTPAQLPQWLRGLAARPEPGPQELAQPERKELPPNVIPITAAKKRVAAKPKAKAKPAGKARSVARSVAAKRK